MRRRLLSVAATSFVASYAGAVWAIRTLQSLGMLRDPRA